MQVHDDNGDEEDDENGSHGSGEKGIHILSGGVGHAGTSGYLGFKSGKQRERHRNSPFHFNRSLEVLPLHTTVAAY